MATIEMPGLARPGEKNILRACQGVIQPADGQPGSCSIISHQAWLHILHTCSCAIAAHLHKHASCQHSNPTTQASQPAPATCTIHTNKNCEHMLQAPRKHQRAQASLLLLRSGVRTCMVSVAGLTPDTPSTSRPSRAGHCALLLQAPTLPPATPGQLSRTCQTQHSLEPQCAACSLEQPRRASFLHLCKHLQQRPQHRREVCCACRPHAVHDKCSCCQACRA